MKCKICSSNSEALAKAKIVRKYEIQYFKCPKCGFVQTEDPYWLPEVYSNPLQKDTGTIRRNLIMAAKTAAIIQVYFNPNGRFLDFGAGDGMFVRHMRDIGYDFYWADKYATNIFSFGFNAPEGERFDLLTSFEVFEHLPNPVPEIEAMLARADNILFSTGVYPAHNPKPEEWGYFSLHGGQHIALYAKETLEYLASTFNRYLISDGHSLHLFSKKKLSPAWFGLLTKMRVASLVAMLRRRKGLTDSDHAAIIQKMTDEAARTASTTT